MKLHNWSLICISALLLITVACAPVPAPVLEVVGDPPPDVVDVPEMKFPIQGTRLVESEVVLTGIGTPRSGIQVLVDGQVVATTRAGSRTGNWSARTTITEQGEHEVVVQALTAGGAVGAKSDPITVVYAGPIPREAAMTKAEPATEAKPASESSSATTSTSSSDSASSSSSATSSGSTSGSDSTSAPASQPAMAAPTLNMPGNGSGLEAGPIGLSGSGEAGTMVQVVLDGEVVGEAEVGSDGAWSLEVTVDDAGDHQLAVQTLNTDGSVASESEPVTISVTAAMAAMADTAKKAAFSPELIFPIDGADVLVGQLTVLGSGDPGTEVEVLDGATVLGVTEVDGGGEWAYTFTPVAANYQLMARVPGDAAMASVAISVRVSADKDDIDCDFSNPGINRGDDYIVGTCDTLNEISQDLNISYEELVAVNPQVNPDVDLIYPGQILNLP